jgi:hypothetical protein
VTFSLHAARGVVFAGSGRSWRRPRGSLDALPVRDPPTSVLAKSTSRQPAGIRDAHRGTKMVGMDATIEVPKPRLLRIMPDGIPAELKALDQLVVYRLILRDGR